MTPVEEDTKASHPYQVAAASLSNFKTTSRPVVAISNTPEPELVYCNSLLCFTLDPLPLQSCFFVHRPIWHATGQSYAGVTKIPN